MESKMNPQLESETIHSDKRNITKDDCVKLKSCQGCGSMEWLPLYPLWRKYCIRCYRDMKRGELD